MKVSIEQLKKLIDSNIDIIESITNREIIDINKRVIYRTKDIDKEYPEIKTYYENKKVKKEIKAETTKKSKKTKKK
jgi:hypothetical protein